MNDIEDNLYSEEDILKELESRGKILIELTKGYLPKDIQKASELWDEIMSHMGYKRIFYDFSMKLNKEGIDIIIERLK